MTEVSQIWMFHTGRSRIRRPWLEEGARREACWLPVLCYLLIHPQGPVLVDTGLGRRALDLGTAPWGKLLSTVLRLTYAEGMDCRSRIAQCGVDPAQLRYGLLTHLHIDHTGGLPDLPEATFRLSQRELEWAEAQRGLKALGRGLVQRDFRGAANLEAIEWKAVDDLLPFEVAHDYFGDGAIRAFPTPGHTPGHLSVLVRARGGRDVLITGDAAFTQRHLEGGAGLGLMPKRFANDLRETEHTLHQLRAFARRRENLLVLTMHDPEQGDDAASGPIPLLEGG